MQVDFLLAASKCNASLAELDFFYAQDAGLKFYRAVDIRYRQNQVIDSINLHCLSRYGIGD
jgi:hypothetical protein